ncbi:MAG: creatininase family protein [Chloroflexota bacterium]|nr:creatininase family protein [Chloroflexota bacterium]
MSIYYADLTSEEIADAARADAIVVLPAGCTEQQGPHLPVDVDSFLISTFVSEAARLAQQEGIRVYVLPTLPYGPAEEHMAFPGTISISAETHARIVGEILDSLVAHGFRRLVVAEGCGGHQLYHACLEARARARNQGKKVLVWRLAAGGEAWVPLVTEVFGERPLDFHAGEVATAIALYLRPEGVRQEKVAKPDQKFSGGNLTWFAGELSDSGGGGDPTRASAEAGQKLVEGIAQLYLGQLRAIAATPL